MLHIIFSDKELMNKNESFKGWTNLYIYKKKKKFSHNTSQEISIPSYENTQKNSNYLRKKNTQNICKEPITKRNFKNLSKTL